ncbi:MAG: hypothetical protein ACM3MF_07965, partial [Anaerolineae bacterium]
MASFADALSGVREQTGKSGPARWELVLLALLVFSAFGIRIYRLGDFPDTVLADEADNAQDSVRTLHELTPENGFF